MKIAIVHLTRMYEGHICAAGIDLDTKKHVRPMLRGGMRCGSNLLARFGGPFDIANVVDLGKTVASGLPPEVEDYLFMEQTAKFVYSVDPISYWKLLRQAAKPGLREIFGEDLTPRGTSAIVEKGKGSASLGCLELNVPAKIYLRPRPDKHPDVRLKFKEGIFDLDLSVTDLRLYKEDRTPDSGLVYGLVERLKMGAGIILALGLTRPFAARADEKAVHWLQVNNIHLLEKPVWKLSQADKTKKTL